MINPEFIITGRRELSGLDPHCRFMEISTFQLERLISNASGIGALIPLIRTGNLKLYLKKSEAFRLYGRANIEHWIDEGLIIPRKDGNHSAS